MALAPACGQALPTLEQVPTYYEHEVNAELLYKLCAARASRGVGSPETRRSCGQNSVAFAQHSIMATIEVERRELLCRNIELRLEVSDVFCDGYNYGSDASVGNDRLCVTIRFSVR